MAAKRDIPETGLTTPPKQRTGWFVLALTLITFCVHARVITNGFTWWDDHQTIHQNPDLNPPSLEKTLHYWRSPHMGLYVPVTYTAWSGIAALAYDQTPGRFNIRLDPIPFHAAGVVVHTLTTLAVFMLLRRLVNADAASFVGALVYALHPVQVEPVAWTSGMKDLLYGSFSAVALCQYVVFAQTAGKKARISYSLSLLSFGLALLSKPSAVTVPLIAAIIDVLVVRRPLRNVILSVAPFAIGSLMIAVVTKLVQTPFHAEPSPIWARPLIAADAVAFYLYKIVFPFLLAPDYGRRPAHVLSSGWIYVSWLVPAGIAVLLWRFRRRVPFLIVAALIPVIATLPVLGLVPFEFQAYSTTADHYLYLAMLGPALAVAWLFSRRLAPVPLGAASVVLVIYGMLSVAQAGRWHDDAALWSHTLRVNPRSWLAATNLGVEYARQNRPHDAGRMYALAVELNPAFLNARDALAGYYVSTGRTDAAAEQLRALIAIAEGLPAWARPNLAGPYNKLGEALMQLRRPADAAQAFEKALNELSDGPGAEQVRANLERARTRLPSTRPAG